jgi:hypothetical protein
MTTLTLSTMIDIPYSTLTAKLAGKAPIKLSEAKSIKKALGTDISIDELFESVDDEAS